MPMDEYEGRLHSYNHKNRETGTMEGNQITVVILYYIKGKERII